MAPVAAALSFVAIVGAGAANLRVHRQPDFPSNWDDYTRGHQPQHLYPRGAEPGKRASAKAPGEGLPAFNAGNRTISPEQFVIASPKDALAAKCAPGGQSFGHYFYNVWEPEIVKFIVPVGAEGRKDTSVVVAPGGGGAHLEWEPEGTAIAEWLNSIGISAFVVKYRIPDATYELMLSDVQRAMSLARSQAEKFKLNPKRIGFAGFGASGTLGMWLGESVRRNYKRIDEVDDVDFHANFLILGYPEVYYSAWKNMELVPPTFIATSEDDPCAPTFMTRIWVDKMREEHNSTPLVTKHFYNGKHGWATCDLYSHLKKHVVCTWKDYAVKFLKGHNLLDEA